MNTHDMKTEPKIEQAAKMDWITEHIMAGIRYGRSTAKPATGGQA